MTLEPRELPDDVEALKALIVQRDERIRMLESENRLLRSERFEPKSERRASDGFQLDPAQMHLLFPELIEAAERVADEKHVEGSVEIKVLRARGVPKRRKQFPPHLPVMRTSFELPIEQRGCNCGGTMEQIGEEVTKELERLELAVVHEIARVKYACKAVTVRRSTFREGLDGPRGWDQPPDLRARRSRMLARWASTTLAHFCFQP